MKKKKLPTYEEWKQKGDEGHPPDVHLPKEENWQSNYIEKYKRKIQHMQCGHFIDSKSFDAFCPHCGAWVNLKVEGRGRFRKPRVYYSTTTRGYYCPHCLKTTSFKFLDVVEIEKGIRGSAWQCECHTIHIHPDDPLVTDITLVGPKWSIANLTLWREKR